jgi:hypothetical protein
VAHMAHVHVAALARQQTHDGVGHVWTVKVPAAHHTVGAGSEEPAGEAVGVHKLVRVTGNAATSLRACIVGIRMGGGVRMEEEEEEE